MNELNEPKVEGEAQTNTREEQQTDAMCTKQIVSDWTRIYSTSSEIDFSVISF